MKKNLGLLTAVVVVAFASVALAMPSQDEISEVQPLVARLMEPSVAAFRTKKMSGSEVGDEALKLSGEAEGEAAKFLCMRGAVTYYVKDKEYDKAAKTIEDMMEQFPDMPAETLQEITSSATKGVSAKSAPKLFELHGMAKKKAANAKKLRTVKKQLKEKPADKGLIRQYAELSAANGNWEEALKYFAKLGGDVGKMAKNEIEGDASAVTLAGFWWDYKAQEAGAKDAIRQHSAMYYQSAIDSGELKGLNKTLAEKCIAELAERHIPVTKSTARYCVIDVSKGPEARNYPVSYLLDIPKGGWTAEYKTDKIVLRRCSAGDDPLKRYTLTKDFFVGVFEITQKQWELVMGSNPSAGRSIGDTYPVNNVSYDMIRGASAGSQWPASADVDANSFLGRLRSRTGIQELDLPTYAQWEYACRAGTTTVYNTGNDESALAAAGWYAANSNSSPHLVGQKAPNGWGLYDMHGNIWELCRDWNGGNRTGPDPVGPASGTYRRGCGGSWSLDAKYCGSGADSGGTKPFGNGTMLGLRLFRTMP